ncbi:MAG: hypothetical protein HYY63_00965 [Elusimicrobia bacterium]|nr:hypothetical protein [Elusimicrobiota bacterium]
MQRAGRGEFLYRDRIEAWEPFNLFNYVWAYSPTSYGFNLEIGGEAGFYAQEGSETRTLTDLKETEGKILPMSRTRRGKIFINAFGQGFSINEEGHIVIYEPGHFVVNGMESGIDLETGNILETRDLPIQVEMLGAGTPIRGTTFLTSWLIVGLMGLGLAWAAHTFPAKPSKFTFPPIPVIGDLQRRRGEKWERLTDVKELRGFINRFFIFHGYAKTLRTQSSLDDTENLELWAQTTAKIKDLIGVLQGFLVSDEAGGLEWREIGVRSLKKRDLGRMKLMTRVTKDSPYISADGKTSIRINPISQSDVRSGDRDAGGSGLALKVYEYKNGIWVERKQQLLFQENMQVSMIMTFSGGNRQVILKDGQVWVEDKGYFLMTEDDTATLLDACEEVKKLDLPVTVEILDLDKPSRRGAITIKIGGILLLAGIGAAAGWSVIHDLGTQLTWMGSPSIFDLSELNSLLGSWSPQGWAGGIVSSALYASFTTSRARKIARSNKLDRLSSSSPEEFDLKAQGLSVDYRREMEHLVGAASIPTDSKLKESVWLLGASDELEGRDVSNQSDFEKILRKYFVSNSDIVPVHSNLTEEMRAPQFEVSVPEGRNLTPSLSIAYLYELLGLVNSLTPEKGEEMNEIYNRARAEVKSARETAHQRGIEFAQLWQKQGEDAVLFDLNWGWNKANKVWTLNAIRSRIAHGIQEGDRIVFAGALSEGKMRNILKKELSREEWTALQSARVGFVQMRTAVLEERWLYEVMVNRSLIVRGEKFLLVTVNLTQIVRDGLYESLITIWQPDPNGEIREVIGAEAIYQKMKGNKLVNVNA